MLHIVSLRHGEAWQLFSCRLSAKPQISVLQSLVMLVSFAKAMQDTDELWRHGENKGKTDDDAHDEWLHPVGASACVNSCVVFLKKPVWWVSDWHDCGFLHQLSLLYLPQWVQRWAVLSGSASPPRCPPRGLSPASWHTCQGLWWASAWGSWFSAATRRASRNSAPGGSSCSPSLPSFFSPSSGTYLRMSCWVCRYPLRPDEGPHPHPECRFYPDPNQRSPTTSSNLDKN